MFRRYLCAFILVQGLALAWPASSLAIDWYWIDSLSGPKFKGVLWDWRVACFKYKPTEEEPEAAAQPPADEKVRVAGVLVGIGGSIGPSCEYEHGDRRQGSIQVGFGFLSSKPTDRFAGNESVKLTTLEPTFMWQIHPEVPVEAGLGAAMYWFSSRGLDSFHRATFQPLRLDFRPFDWDDTNERGNWWKSAIILRFGIIVFPQGFAQADFRDTQSGTEPREIKKYYGLAFDTEPLVRRFVSRTWSKDQKRR